MEKPKYLPAYAVQRYPSEKNTSSYWTPGSHIQVTADDHYWGCRILVYGSSHLIEIWVTPHPLNSNSVLNPLI